MTSPHPHNNSANFSIHPTPPLNLTGQPLRGPTKYTFRIPRLKHPPSTPPSYQPSSAQYQSQQPLHHPQSTLPQPHFPPNFPTSQVQLHSIPTYGQYYNQPLYSTPSSLFTHAPYEPYQPLHFSQSVIPQCSQALYDFAMQSAHTPSTGALAPGLNYLQAPYGIQPHIPGNIDGRMDHLNSKRIAEANLEESGDQKHWKSRCIEGLRTIAKEDASVGLARVLSGLKAGKEDANCSDQVAAGELGMQISSGSAGGYPGGHVEAMRNEREGRVDALHGSSEGIGAGNGASSDQYASSDGTVGQRVGAGHTVVGKSATENLGREEHSARGTAYLMEMNHGEDMGCVGEQQVYDGDMGRVCRGSAEDTVVPASQFYAGNEHLKSVPRAAEFNNEKNLQEAGNVELGGQIKQAWLDSWKDVQVESPRANGLDRPSEEVWSVLNIDGPLRMRTIGDGVDHGIVKGELPAENSQFELGRLADYVIATDGGAIDVSTVMKEEDKAGCATEMDVSTSAVGANMLKKGEDVVSDVPRTMSGAEEIKEACFLDQMESKAKDEDERGVLTTGSNAWDGGISTCEGAEEVMRSKLPQIRPLGEEHTINDSSLDLIDGTQLEKLSESELTPEWTKSELSSPRSRKLTSNISKNGTRCTGDMSSLSERISPLLQAHSRTDEAVEAIKDEYDACTIPLAGMGRGVVRERETRDRKRNKAGICIKDSESKGRLKSMFDSDDDDFEDVKTSKARSVSRKRNCVERAKKANSNILGEKKTKSSRSALRPMFNDEETVDMQPSLKKLKTSRRTPKGGVSLAPKKTKQRKKESVFDEKPKEAIGRSKRSGLPDSSDEETDEDFIPRNTSKAKEAQARRRSTLRNEKASSRAKGESTSLSQKQVLDIDLEPSPRKRSSSRTRGSGKNTKTIDLTAASPVKKGSVAEDEEVDDATSPSQGGGSQPLDIVVEPIKERKKGRRRFADYLYRKLTEDDASLIRQAFIKFYRTPPSNGTMQGCYELKHGREMSEALKKKLWETKLKPWSDRWWELYQKFGEVGREIKRQKEKKDVKPALNMRELTTAAKKFYEEHGDAQPQEQQGNKHSIVTMLSLD